MKPVSSEARPTLFYDGLCALCNGSVRFLLKFDRNGSLQFAPLTGPTAQSLLASHPDLASIDSLVVVAGSAVLVRSAAVLWLLRYLGGGWTGVAWVGHRLPAAFRDRLYDVIARWRYRAFGRYESCPLPPASVRDRFLP
ncbi:MAG: thiol-disulfide oxidoreductase DCC family protein [Gemmatimonadales bacterium]